MELSGWLSNNWIEIFGAVTGIIYVFLEIRQNLWLWPVGIITSAVYIWVFFTSKFYADMSLQGYYLVISCLGWYWWVRGAGAKRLRDEGTKRLRDERTERLRDSRSEATQFRKAEEGRREEEKGRKIERERGRSERSENPVSLTKEGETGEGEEENNTLQVTRLKLRTGVVLAIVFALLYIVMWYILSRWTDSPVPGWDSFITSLSIIATWMLARKIYEHWFLWIVVNAVSTLLFLTRGLYPTFVLYIIYGIMSIIGLRSWKRTICDEPENHISKILPGQDLF